MMLACCTSSAMPPVSPSTSGYRNVYSGVNPLGIQPASARGNNYFLVIGDWGKADGPGPCQLAVATMMKRYVANQRAVGRKLLFVATAGDNFYWSGVKLNSWETSWAAPYGTNDPNSPLYKVPWLAVLGNHDYGNDDPYAFCPRAQVQAMASMQGQAYGSMQFNADKNPWRPRGTEHFWLPDYNYHYEIPQVDLEVIALDTNIHFLSSLGGDGQGHGQAFDGCGGAGEVESFLSQVAAAGLQLLEDRARFGTAKTVLILQHYPGSCPRSTFEAALRPGREVHVICAYGHDHNQACEGWDSRGNCNAILSGGGGGCCAPEVARAGFAAVRLTEDGAFQTDVDSGEVALPPGACHLNRRLMEFI